MLEDNKDEVSFSSTVSKQSSDTFQIAIVWLPLVQYYTAQLFDIPPLAKKAHQIGALIGLDLAHGSGNVECKLDDWGIDFAVWCTYKCVLNKRVQ